LIPPSFGRVLQLKTRRNTRLRFIDRLIDLIVEEIPLDRPLMPSAPPESTTVYRPITLFYMASITALLVPVLTLVDAPVSAYLESSNFPRDFVSALELSLVFSHGTGVFLVLMAILMLAPRLRWQVPRLAALALGGGALATITKMFVLRPRPSELDLEYAGHESAWLWAIDWDLSEIATFDTSFRAFPSGNVVTATAFTIGLWILLPRGRALFATIWAGVLLQRLNTGTHFVSDLCGGVAIGLMWSFICYHPKLMGTLFDRMAPEPRRKRRGGGQLIGSSTTHDVEQDSLLLDQPSSEQENDRHRHAA